MNYETRKKLRKLKAKTLRFLGITKPIALTPEDIKWIRLCKGHFNEEERFRGKSDFIDVLKPMFVEIYGWSADEYYKDFLDCMFRKLLGLHLKIKDDQSGNNIQLYNVFSACLYDQIYSTGQPIERAIKELCSQIRNTVVFEDGVHRFHLK